MPRPRIAVTLGDPRGIGPEVALQAVSRFGAEEAGVVVRFVGPFGPIDPDEVAGYTDGHRQGSDAADAEAGAVAAASIEHAVAAAARGEVQALVTGPVHKPSLHAAGHATPGQTELLARLTGSEPVGMLMAAEHTALGGPLRVLLATTHVSLREVPDLVDEELLVEQARLLDATLRRDWKIATPRLALCALNPHASDGGLFGTEEEDLFEPAARRLASAGVCIEGPVPADTVFARALGGEFDAVVAPYHDVGMAAFKTVSFRAGVNVTIGLPFVRTSPDHGTAFAIAGKGEADASSMLEALKLAARLAHARFDTDSSHV